MKPNITALIPIARLGRWFHPVYKNRKGEPVVEFLQADFDSIREAFETNDRGYPPMLRYGHLQKGSGIADGEPAIGWMKSIKQVDDVLLGEFELNNEEVLDEILSNKYRYSSGEFVHGLPSKIDGRPLRVFLKAVALTNTPFVPGLPKNVIKVTSEDTAEYTLLSDVYLQENPMNLTEDQINAVETVFSALGDSPVITKDLLSALVIQTSSLSLSEQAAIATKIKSISADGNLTLSQIDNIATQVPNETIFKDVLVQEVTRISQELRNFSQPEETTSINEINQDLSEKMTKCLETPSESMVGSSSSQGNILQAFSEKLEKMFNNFFDRLKKMPTETETTQQEQLADESAPPLDPTVTEQESEEDMGMDEKALSELQLKLQAAEELLKKQEVALSEKDTALATLEAEKALKANHDHDVMLSELTSGLVAKGLAPAVASKVKDFMVNARSTEVNLSEHAGHTVFAQSLVSLLSEVLDPANHVELSQAGTSVSESNLSDDNPWVSYGFMGQKKA